MKVVLLRVGIDTGAGGIHSPLLADGTFEFVPIPDGLHLDERTYGNTIGRTGRRLVEYFPPRRRQRMAGQSIHVDPELDTFSYGDPTPPKAGLRSLEPGDVLAFYSGLEGWDTPIPPALYLVGYFEVARAGLSTEFSDADRRVLFSENFHVRHPSVYADQRARLVLVKGTPSSRLLTRPVRISEVGQSSTGAPLHRLSKQMQAVFGDFGGRTSIQRSPPRWVANTHVDRASAFLRSLV